MAKYETRGSSFLMQNRNSKHLKKSITRTSIHRQDRVPCTMLAVNKPMGFACTCVYNQTCDNIVTAVVTALNNNECA